MSPIRAVLLDFDGVIANTIPLMRRILHSFFRDKKFFLPYSEFDQNDFSTKSLRQILTYIKEVHGYDIDIDEISLYINQHQMQIALKEWWEFDISLPIFLEYCQRNLIALSIGSNSRSARIISVLSQLNILSCFALKPGTIEKYAIIWSEGLTHFKPDPEVWVRSAEQLNTPLSECLVIEDGLPGIIWAKACGARSVYYHHFCDPDKECLKESDCWVSDFFQVIDFIESQNVPTK